MNNYTTERYDTDNLISVVRDNISEFSKEEEVDDNNDDDNVSLYIMHEITIINIIIFFFFSLHGHHWCKIYVGFKLQRVRL